MSSRGKNSIRNFAWGVVNKLSTLLGQFALRTIIIQVLGAEYLGLDGLFVSILQILNLTELGFSNAIIYCLYEPLAENNITHVRSLLSFYRKIYRYVGLTILLLGLTMIPFLPLFINGNIPDGFNLIVFYLLYLFNTFISYFLFAYKSALITACQRADLLSKILTISRILQYVAQIAVLLITGNFYLYAGVMVVCTIINNLLTEYISRRYYPQYFCQGNIDSTQKQAIRKLVFGIMVQKICQTFRNSFDNICLSLFAGLTIVAIYGNYYFVLTMAVSFCGIITSSIQASIGNGVAVNDEKKNYTEMNNLIFGYAWLSGWMSICMLCLYTPFMYLWVGQELSLPFYVVVLFCLYFYSLSMGDIRALYHSAAGLWWEGKSVWIVEALLNLILNFLLGYLFGVAGIVLATILTVLFINFGFGSLILFKYYFTSYSVKNYFFTHLKYASITIAIGALTYYICDLIPDDLQFRILFLFVVCMIIPNIFYFLIYRRNDVFKSVVKSSFSLYYQRFLKKQ